MNLPLIPYFRYVTMIFISLLHFNQAKAMAMEEGNEIQIQATSDSSGINKGRLAFVIATEASLYTAGLLYLSQVWYADMEMVPFQFYNDNAGWLQMDKFAHSYVAYHQSYWGYQALIWAGVDKKKALWYGGTLGFVLQFPIEVFDGLYEGYGFSVGDVIANTVGAALFMGQQAAWDEQKILPKFSFWPSQYPSLRPGTLGRTWGEQLVMDYNAQTYWFSFSPASVLGWENWPEWLCFSLGYSGNGMLGEFENPDFIRGESVEHIQRYRQYLFSLDLDTRKIPTNRAFLKGLFHAINLIKIPAPAIEVNRIQGIRLHPVHF